MYNLSSFRHNIRGLICTSIYWWNCQVKHTPSLCQENFKRKSILRIPNTFICFIINSRCSELLLIITNYNRFFIRNRCSAHCTIIYLTNIYRISQIIIATIPNEHRFFVPISNIRWIFISYLFEITRCSLKQYIIFSVWFTTVANACNKYIVLGASSIGGNAWYFNILIFSISNMNCTFLVKSSTISPFPKFLFGSPIIRANP